MNDQERRGAAINAFRYFDPESQGGVYLPDVADRVARNDIAFMRKYNLMTKALKLIGVDRGEDMIRYRYLARMYPITANLERLGVIDSDWEDSPDTLEDQPRRRVYRYLGFSGLKSTQESS